MDEPLGDRRHAVDAPQQANIARIYNAWVGGKDNYAQDRAVASAIGQLVPSVPAAARENRRFLARVVRHLSAQGIDQFLDLGAGLPSAGPVHEVAQELNPTVRTVYVDFDPVVVAHARAILVRDDLTLALQGDLRDPAEILARPELRAHLDLSRPVAVLMLAVLHFVTDAEDPAGIVRTIAQGVAPGSPIVVSHGTPAPAPVGAGTAPQVVMTEEMREAAALYSRAAAPINLRSPDVVAAMLDGLVLEAPGLVPLSEWHPDGTESEAVSGVGVLARTPV